MRKFLILLLTLAMVCGTFAGCELGSDSSGGGDQPIGEPGTLNNDFKVGGTFILSSSTEPKGEFRWPGLGTGSANATDQDVVKLTSGYDTMEVNAAGDYVWNNTAVKSHSAEEIPHEGGAPTYKMTIELNDNLVFSDGTPIKAENYLAYTMVMSTPVSQEAHKMQTGGQALVGFRAFKDYDGTNGENASKVFPGIRLLGDYKFSFEISEDYYPYYYAVTYGAAGPTHLGLLLGGHDKDENGNPRPLVKDDGQGAYLADFFYEKNPEGALKTYKLSDDMANARVDINTYPYSGPYYVESWDNSSKVATLKINDKYLGNFEGQKPHIEKILIKHVVSETQTGHLKQGMVDMITGLTGGEDVRSALAVRGEAPDKFNENHYDRAGYGKLQFECDFGPTMFKEVRHAVAYSFNRDEFADAFCGGYGAVVNGPYSSQFSAYKANEAELENLNAYPSSAANAKQALIDGGWIYNSRGEAFEEGKEGVDAVRYKKLDAEDITDENKAFKSVSNVDSVEYKTVQVGEDYYMPCVINWFGTDQNTVTDLLTTKLYESPILAQAGMLIRKTTGSFTMLLDQIYREGDSYGGTPVYGMYNLALGWNTSMYDNAFNWVSKYDTDYEMFFPYSANKLSDIYDKDFRYEDHKGLSFDEAKAQSGGKLGMNYLSMSMVYTPKELGVAADDAEYYKWWGAFIERWNELLPDIPLYSNVYYDVYSSKLLNFRSTPFCSPAKALLYCAIKDAQ